MNACGYILALVALLLALRMASVGPASKISAIPFKFPGEGLPNLAENRRILDKAEKLFKGEIIAPEHYAFDKEGGIYMSQSCACRGAPLMRILK
jgi:hypothetical protein